jgi:uncharacterized protein (DUF1330 family)
MLKPRRTVMSLDALTADLAINPTEAQLEHFLNLELGTDITMINHHQYHDKAQYPEGYVNDQYDLNVSGREAYHRYLSTVVNEILPQVPGAKIISIPCKVVMIGDIDWQEIVIGYYSSRDTMLAIGAQPAYAEAVIHRIAGLKTVQTVGLQGNLLQDFSTRTR